MQRLLKALKAYYSLFSLTTIILVATLLIISTSLTLNGNYYYYFHHSALAVPHSLPPPALVGPTIVNNETHLKIETVFTGLRSPTSMAFLGPNDILVLEKSQETVQRIVNGKMATDWKSLLLALYSKVTTVHRSLIYIRYQTKIRI